MSTFAIQAEGLHKRYGDHVAVDGVDLAVPAGSVYGFLGPNGSGKTTTIRMLATLIRPTDGRAWVLGHDVVAEADAVRSRISLTGQYASVDDDLTGLENLQLMGRLLGHPRRAARTAPTSCSPPSGSRTPATAGSRATPAACAADSTSPRASW